jgi:hypothetical protein
MQQAPLVQLQHVLVQHVLMQQVLMQHHQCLNVRHWVGLAGTM